MQDLGCLRNKSCLCTDFCYKCEGCGTFCRFALTYCNHTCETCKQVELLRQGLHQKSCWFLWHFYIIVTFFLKHEFLLETTSPLTSNVQLKVVANGNRWNFFWACIFFKYWKTYWFHFYPNLSALKFVVWYSETFI